MNLTPVTIGTSALSTSGLTITVRLSRPLRFRLWLAAQLLRLAAWLMGGKADIALVDSA